MMATLLLDAARSGPILHSATAPFSFPSGPMQGCVPPTPLLKLLDGTWTIPPAKRVS